eukprot:3791517-Amphidinium_carterae.1
MQSGSENVPTVRCGSWLARPVESCHQAITVLLKLGLLLPSSVFPQLMSVGERTSGFESLSECVQRSTRKRQKNVRGVKCRRNVEVEFLVPPKLKTIEASAQSWPLLT